MMSILVEKGLLGTMVSSKRKVSEKITSILYVSSVLRHAISTQTEPSRGSLYVFTSMTLAHNTFIRYLKSIYLQATGVHKSNPKDITDFLFYCQSWCSVVHEHHAGEEKLLFPMLDALTGQTNIMGHSIEQHHELLAGMDEFEKYVRTVTVDDYSGRILQEIIDGFADALVTHLQEEPLALLEVGETYGGEKLATCWDELRPSCLRRE